MCQPNLITDLLIYKRYITFVQILSNNFVDSVIYIANYKMTEHQLLLPKYLQRILTSDQLSMHYNSL